MLSNKKGGSTIVCPGCGLEFHRENGTVTVQQALDQIGRDLSRDNGLCGLHYEFGEDAGLNTEYVLELDDVVEDSGAIVFRMDILEPDVLDEKNRTYDAHQSMEAVKDYILGHIRSTFRYLRDMKVRVEFEHLAEVGA